MRNRILFVLMIAFLSVQCAQKKDIIQERDGWTIKTKDRKPAAHFEHDVAVRNGKAEILSSFEWIEGNQ